MNMMIVQVRPVCSSECVSTLLYVLLLPVGENFDSEFRSAAAYFLLLMPWMNAKKCRGKVVGRVLHCGLEWRVALAWLLTHYTDKRLTSHSQLEKRNKQTFCFQTSINPFLPNRFSFLWLQYVYCNWAPPDNNFVRSLGYWNSQDVRRGATGCRQQNIPHIVSKWSHQTTALLAGSYIFSGLVVVTNIIIMDREWWWWMTIPEVFCHLNSTGIWLWVDDRIQAQKSTIVHSGTVIEFITSEREAVESPQYVEGGEGAVVEIHRAYTFLVPTARCVSMNEIELAPELNPAPHHNGNSIASLGNYIGGKAKALSRCSVNKL